MPQARIIKLHKPLSDEVFFTKEQIKIGQTLRYYGRHDPGSRWVVDRIWTFPPRGQYKGIEVREVQKLSDAVRVIRMKDGEVMELSFSYLSYSSIWRLG